MNERTNERTNNIIRKRKKEVQATKHFEVDYNAFFFKLKRIHTYIHTYNVHTKLVPYGFADVEKILCMSLIPAEDI